MFNLWGEHLADAMSRQDGNIISPTRPANKKRGQHDRHDKSD